MSGLIDLIQKQEPAIKAALPKHITPERIMRVAQTAVRTNPQFAKCDPASFLGALMIASQLGLEINTPLGHAYIVPFGDQCTFIIGYRGLLDLAYRTGLYEMIDAHAVHENDDFGYELGLKPDLRHKPATKNRGAAIGYYAFYRLKNGGHSFRFWTAEEVKDHAEKNSKGFRSRSSPWHQHFDAMAKKTLLKAVMAYAPLSPENRDLWVNVEADNAVVKLNDDKTLDITHANVVATTLENKSTEAELAEREAALAALGE